MASDLSVTAQPRALCVLKPQTRAWLYLSLPNLSMSRLVVFGLAFSVELVWTLAEYGRGSVCVGM